jgi:hypothetical protein
MNYLRLVLLSVSVGNLFILTSAVYAYTQIFAGPASPGLYIPTDGEAINNAGTVIAVSNSGSFSWNASSGSIIHLGSSNGDLTSTQVKVRVINDAGFSAGTVSHYVPPIGGSIFGSSSQTASRWDPLGNVTELGHLGVGSIVSGLPKGTTVTVDAINNSNSIAGTAYKFDEEGLWVGIRAVRWQGNSTVATELGNLGLSPSGSSLSSVTDMNDIGTIVGNSRKYFPGGLSTPRAVRWDSTGTEAIELGTLIYPFEGENLESQALAINSNGTIVGYSDVYDPNGVAGTLAVRWDADSTIAQPLAYLGTTPGQTLGGYTYTSAHAINEVGSIIGTSSHNEQGAFQGSVAVRWDGDGSIANELQNLGLGNGQQGSVAYAINNSNIAVGSANKYDESGVLLGKKAVYWRANNEVVDLNSLIDPASGWINLSIAYDVSDTGWITGIGSYDADGAGGNLPDYRLFLLKIGEGAFRWTGGSGAFGDSENWEGITVPQVADDALFDKDESYDVSFSASAASNNVTIKAGQVTFDLSGFEYDLTQNLAVNEAANLRIKGGLLEAATIDIGQNISANAQVIATGATTRVLADLITIGDAGRGTLAAFGGPSIKANDLSLAIGNDAVGTLNIDQSRIEVANLLYAATAGQASIGITNGAVLEAGSAWFATDSLGRADVDVIGVGSLIEVGGDARIGALGDAVLDFSEGGKMAVGGSAILDGDSTVRVSDAGSSLTVEQTLVVGRTKRGFLTAFSDSKINAANLVVAEQLGSHGELQLGSRAVAEIAGDVVVGSSGSGQMAVSLGGQVFANNLALSANSSSTGSLTARDPESRVVLSENLQIGKQGVAAFENGVSIQIGKDLLAGGGALTLMGADSKLEVNRNAIIGDGASAHVVIREAAIAEIGGKLSIGSDESESNVQVEGKGRLYVKDNVTIGPKATLSGSGIELGRLTGNASLLNQGRLELNGERVKGLLRSTNLSIDGNYTQASDAEMVVSLTSEDRLDLSNVSAAMTVEGTATIAGSLKVELDGFVPDIGHRFAIILADDLKGRFETFEGSNIDGVSDRFMGLNYRRTKTSDAANIGLNEGGIVEAVTLESPHFLNGGRLNQSTGKRDLVFITHGTNSSSEGFQTLASAIESSVLDAENTDVVLFDWSKFAAGGDDGFQNILGFDPFQSANNGINIGESLISWLDTQGALTYERIHLLGHSSGSWLVDAMADSLDRTSAQVQLTLWDAFVPPKGINKQGEDFVTEHDLGDRADFTEHYFDRGLLWRTQELLPNAVNIDITSLNPSIIGPFESHAWPYKWYEESILAQSGTTGIYGFPLSFSAKDNFPTHQGTLARGKNIRLKADGNDEFFKIGVDDHSFSKSELITTGVVNVDQNAGVDFSTNSPAMLTALLDLPTTYDLIRFNFDFVNNAPAIFSLYVGTELVWEINSEFFVQVDGLINSGWISIPEIGAGVSSIIFRLDNIEDTQAKFRLEDVQFGKLIAVPEPSSGVLLIVGALLLIVRLQNHNVRCL